MPKEQVLKCIS